MKAFLQLYMQKAIFRADSTSCIRVHGCTLFRQPAPLFLSALLLALPKTFPSLSLCWKQRWLLPLPFMRGPLCFKVTAVSEVKVSHRNLSAEAVRRTSWFTPLMSRWQTTLCASDLRLCAPPSLPSPPGRLSALLLWVKQKQLDKFNYMPIKMLSLWDGDQLTWVLQWQLVITREQVGR